MRIARTTLSTTAASALAALAVGCGSDDNQASAPPHTAASDPALGVVHVEARYKSKRTEGTGFIYDSRQGLILTSDHAVEAAPTIFVTLKDGTPLHARVLARAQCHDLALLKLHPKPAGLTALPFADSDTVHEGDQVTSLSYALGSASADQNVKLARTQGTVSAVGVKAVLHRLLPPFAPLIAHQTPLNESGSGSPLLNSRSRVIGINMLVGEHHGSGALSGLEYALASNEVNHHLHELRPGPSSAYVGWEHEHKCHQQMNAIAGVRGGMGEAHPMEGNMHSHGS
jgi:S1-C subfamily serine protease